MTPPEWVSPLQRRAEQGEGKEEIKEKQAGKVLPSVTQNQRSRNTHRYSLTHTYTYIYTHISFLVPTTINITEYLMSTS